MSKFADHDDDLVGHVEDELKQAWKDGWDAIVPSALTPDAQWQRNGIYVPLYQVQKRLGEAEGVSVPRTVYDAALNYIRHVGANHVMRGDPHPQQWIVDGLERCGRSEENK